MINTFLNHKPNVHWWCFRFSVEEWCQRGWIYLKNPYPVAAAPLMVRGQTVVALHSGLGEVQLPHISKHHRGLFIHGNRKLCCLGRKHKWIQWNVFQFQTGGEQLMKGDSRVSSGMQLGHNTSHLWSHNMFMNNKLVYQLSTEVILCGCIFLDYFNNTNHQLWTYMINCIKTILKHSF